MKILAKLVIGLLIGSLLMSMTVFAEEAENVHRIVLSSVSSGDDYTHSATLNGASVPEYDYVWHVDPAVDHGIVKNSPAEYYTGTAPSGEDAVYIAHDIYYYPELDESKFQRVNYDGEYEWVYFYEAEGYEKYIFSTLPVQSTGFPSQMMHSESEAYQNAVLHITKAGVYIIEGEWHGQIWIDLGDEDEVFANENEKVTLILNGVDVSCTVAPAIVFASVYECDNTWEDREQHSQNVDTSDAGANIIVADGTVNNISGTNIFRILKTQYKDTASTDAYPAQKKRLKIDGAFYSYQSMNIDGGEIGDGVLNIIAGFEGLDTELHLTIRGGNVNIYSQDDGINVNEDGVSVVTIDGGNLHICAGLGAEGDGIDSNGFLVINGGIVISTANPISDSGLDSDFGSFVNGGVVVALGSTMDWAESDSTSDSTQPVLNMRFAGSQSSDEAIVITDLYGKVVFAYDPDKDEVTGSYGRTYSGAIVSSPSLELGASYYIYIGGDVEGIELSGVYDTSTITAFSGSSVQCYSGNTIGGYGGGMGGNRGEFFNPEDGASLPEFSDRGDGQTFPFGDRDGMTRPDGMESGGEEGFISPPDGMESGNMEGLTPPDERDPAGINGMQGNVSGATCTYETVFTLTDKVNAFASVTDFRHDIVKVEAVAAEYGKNGNIEYYTCTACGELFADAAGTVLLSDGDIMTPSKDYTILIIAIFSLAGVIAVICVVGVIVFVKTRKKVQS